MKKKYLLHRQATAALKARSRSLRSGSQPAASVYPGLLGQCLHPGNHGDKAPSPGLGLSLAPHTWVIFLLSLPQPSQISADCHNGRTEKLPASSPLFVCEGLTPWNNSWLPRRRTGPWRGCRNSVRGRRVGFCSVFIQNLLKTKILSVLIPAG